jgi:hypothetical protein
MESIASFMAHHLFTRIRGAGHKTSLLCMWEWSVNFAVTVAQEC